MSQILLFEIPSASFLAVEKTGGETKEIQLFEKNMCGGYSFLMTWQDFQKWANPSAKLL